MTRPGDRLRRVAARFCSRSAMERLIDPAVADLQAEYQAAVQTGSAWTRVWTLLRGYTACLKVITLCACARSTVVNLGSRPSGRAEKGFPGSASRCLFPSVWSDPAPCHWVRLHSGM